MIEISNSESEEMINKESLYERVVGMIRQDITNGTLVAGEWLKVRVLAERYKVSAAPIREALQVLQGEGVVAMESNRGARVRGIDALRLIHIFDLREAVESYLNAAFAETASPHQIAMLEAIQDQHDDLVSKEKYLEAFEENRKFHDLINMSSRNVEALNVLSTHVTLTRAIRISCGFNRNRMRTIQIEHRQLIEAFKLRDASAARQVSALHVRSSRDDLLSRFPKSLSRKQ